MVITFEVRTFALAFGPQCGLAKAGEIFERMTEEGNSARSGVGGGFSAPQVPDRQARGTLVLGGTSVPPLEDEATRREKKKKEIIGCRV